MNTEILFRAKSVSSNQWVYGNYIHSKRFAGWSNEHRIHNQDTGLESDIYPETVGQFTGRIIREDAKLFEGDIITVKSYNSPYLNQYRYEVYYDSYYLEWRLISHHNGDKHSMIGFHSFEIVGNIHEIL